MVAALLARRYAARTSPRLSRTLRSRSFVTLSAEVADALARRQPVVALESTIVSHGLPYPRNLEAATQVEAMVRQSGAIPATTALIDGQALVGLDAAQLARLAEPPAAQDPRPIKTSRRDIARVLAGGQGAVGGTTVSGTMVLAHAANIPIFATGGIGGVHRGGHNSMDVSADLAELGRTPVAVFCSGAKSILDIPRTLEYLETQGVAVSAFRQASQHATRLNYPSSSSWAKDLSTTTAFPSFYTAASDRQVPLVHSPGHAASIIAASQRAQLGGMVFGVPIPTEHEMGSEIVAVVEQAVRESVELGIDVSGKDATPWLLKRVKELCPASVDSNVALVTNNAKLAAWTASDLATLISQPPTSKVYRSASIPQQEAKDVPNEKQTPLITVVGGAVLDITARMHGETSMAIHTTTPGSVRASLGGVGRNMAEAAQRMLDTIAKAQAAYAPSTLSSVVQPNEAVKFVGPVGNDSMSVVLRSLWTKETPQLRLDGLVPTVSTDGTPTASLVLYPNGDLDRGVIQASLVEHLEPSTVQGALTPASGSAVVLDGNLSVDTLGQTLRLTSTSNQLTVLEPTSKVKSVRVIEALLSSYLQGQPPPPTNLITPNLLELTTMINQARTRVPKVFGQAYMYVESVQSDAALSSLLTDSNLVTEGNTLPGLLTLSDLVGPIALTLGAQGILLVLPPSLTPNVPHSKDCTTWRIAGFGPEGLKEWVLYHSTPPLPVQDLVSTTGAGDTFAGALVALLRVSMSLSGTGAHDVWQHVRAPGALLALAQAASSQTLASDRAVGQIENLAEHPALREAWQAIFEQHK